MVATTLQPHAMQTTGAVQIGFLTDVEGNLEYFDRWVQRSEVLKYDASGRLQLLHDSAYFVFGGDVMDRNHMNG